MILYLAADLLWASKIKGAADALGIPARPVRSVEMLDARLADSPVKALVLDLEAFEVALAMLGRLRAPDAPPPWRSIRVVAFGPHVATQALAQARASGADSVLTRGAFAAGLPQLLQTLDALGATPVPSPRPGL